MSLLIEGMDMPDSCSKCPLKYSSYDMYCCRVICGDGCIVCVDSYTERRNPACPLVKIPTPHGRLIDADRQIAVIKSAAGTADTNVPLSAVLASIENAPTVIEREEV